MADFQRKVDLLVLDYLLTRRGFPTDYALKFGSLLPHGTVEGLDPQTQARLMLRLLFDGQKNGLSEETITCLNIISSVDVRGVTSASIAPAPELTRQVKVELIAQACRTGQATPDNLQSTIDHYFPDPKDAAQKAEVFGLFCNPAAAQTLLTSNNMEAVGNAVVQFAQTAQSMLGPPPLETIIHQGLVHASLAQPAVQPQAQPAKKRGRPPTKKTPSGSEAPGAAAAADQAGAAVNGESELAQRSKQLKALGSDPAGGAHAVAANLLRQQPPQPPAEQHQAPDQQQLPQSSFVADVQQAAAAAEPAANGVTGLVEGGDGRGRVITWDTPPQQGNPSAINPLSAALALGSHHGPLQLSHAALPTLNAPLVVQPLDSPAAEDGAEAKTRRKVGRWREEETNELINLTQIHGRGKWKLILEKGNGIFENRTQVDLKDKWRNLVRQGAVNPDLFPSPEGRSRPRAALENEQQEQAEREAVAPAPSAGTAAAPHAEAAQVPGVEDGGVPSHSQAAAMPTPGTGTPGGRSEDPIEDSQTPSQQQQQQQPQAQFNASGMPLMQQPMHGFMLPQSSPPFAQRPQNGFQMAPPASAMFVQAGGQLPQLHASSPLQASVSTGRQ